MTLDWEMWTDGHGAEKGSLTRQKKRKVNGQKDKECEWTKRGKKDHEQNVEKKINHCTLVHFFPQCVIKYFPQTTLLSFFSCLVSHSCSHSLFPCLSICEGPTSLLSEITLLCQYKSYTHIIAYIGNTHTYHPLMCWKRVTFLSDWVLTLSSKLLPEESWVRQTSSVNSEKSLIFLSDTFSPLAPKNTVCL